MANVDRKRSRSGLDSFAIEGGRGKAASDLTTLLAGVAGMRGDRLGANPEGEYKLNDFDEKISP